MPYNLLVGLRLSVGQVGSALDTVPLVQIVSERFISKVWPVTFVKAFCAFKLFLGYVHHQDTLVMIVWVHLAFDGLEWHGEHLVTDTQKTTVGNRDVLDFASLRIQHNVVDFTYVLLL